MNLEDVLPEEWVKVAYKRRLKYWSRQLKLIISDGISVEKCFECPFFRADNDTGRIYTLCTANKCIKQYPTYTDRKEFV